MPDNRSGIKYWNGYFYERGNVCTYVKSFIQNDSTIDWEKLDEEYGEEYEIFLNYKNGVLREISSTEEEIKDFVLSECIIIKDKKLKETIQNKKEELATLLSKVKNLECTITKLKSRLQ